MSSMRLIAHPATWGPLTSLLTFGPNLRTKKLGRGALGPRQGGGYVQFWMFCTLQAIRQHTECKLIR
jgi:hypothetical protein